MDMTKVEYDLQTDYRGLLGDWAGPLNQLTKSSYMHNLMVFLEESYRTEADILPRKDQVFEAFKKTPFFGLKVVIVGDEPYPTFINNGLAFGVSSNILNPPAALKKVRDCIEKQSDKMTLNFDYSMESWAKQGVLMLNSSLTTKFITPNTHKPYWKNFTREVIRGINLRKHDIVFILLGNDARQFKHLITTPRNHVLEYHHPRYAVTNNQAWNCPCFGYANSIIKKVYDESHCINW